MLINALQLADNKQKEVLQNWINAKEYVPEEKIKGVTEIYDQINIKELCNNKIVELFNDALNDLSQVNIEDAKKQPLIDFANWLMTRNK